jgi:glycosyltransferase involved in cell wall biosynthesis
MTALRALDAALVQRHAPDEAREIELSIVMPCLDEAETLGVCIRKAQAFLAENDVVGEIIIADNGSTDGSQQIARCLGARVVDVPERGYGAALIHGIRSASGRYVAMGDSDDSYDFLALMPFLEKLRAGSDLVIGNRFSGGIADGAMPALHRYLGNPALSFIGRLFYSSGIGDFHCGLRAFSREAVLGLGLSAPGMEFASEMVVKAHLADLRIAEVPTTLARDGRSRPPHLRSWRDGWRHLKFLLTYAPKWLFFYPGATLAAAGGIGLAALLPGSIELGGIRLDVHSMLFAAAGVLIGSQLMSFAVIARLFGVREGYWAGSARLAAARRWLSIDRGCVIGGLILLAGLLTAAVALGGWVGSGLGDMKVEVLMRLVIPSVLLTALGIQIVFTSFMVGLLEQKPQR